MKIILKKCVDFGKRDFFGLGKKVNACDVEIELRQYGKDAGDGCPDYVELSICGRVWNVRHSDIVSGGQNLDSMALVIKDEKFKKIHEIWKRWHLNGLNAGTPEQEAKVKEWLDAGNRYDYDAVCSMLKDCGLYEVEFTGKTSGRMYDHELYKYGHGWVVEDLPADVIEFVKGV